MILSCFMLDSLHPSVRQCLSNAHDMHRSVMTGFVATDSVSARKDQGVLYRLLPKGQKIVLYVLSQAYPDWSRLSKGFEMVDLPKDITGTVDSFYIGRHLGFDLLAVASKKISQDGANSRRIFLPTPEQREQWLLRKAKQNGFSVIWAREDGQEKAYVRKKKDSESAAHTGVRFRGELQIVDQLAFQKAFCHGIGAGKAYGMGMLMLFPVRG